MVNNPQEMMKKSCHEYMEALEDERRKIQVFHRELPLCLELVNQAIESCKRQLSCSERSDCEEQMQMTTMSSEGPVLEEFIPLKRSPSSECEEEQSEHDKADDNKLEKKVDWLRSVQLWNQTTDLSSKEEDSQGKHSVIEAKKNGGAFHPFRKEKSETTTTTTATRTVTPTAAASSTADNGNKSSREDRSQSNKKTRRCWSPELHRRFLQALQQLGGSHAATPKQIRELMKVDGLTNDEVKSHLQKYRLHTRRPGTPHNQTTAAATTNPQPTQFVVVGGIWVPPPEYAATMASSKGEAPPPACTKGIYVPVAAPPPPPQHAPQLTLFSCTEQQQQQQQKQKQMVLQRPAVVGSSHVSDGRSSRGSGGRTHDSSADSPTATCSSTDTTTASPALF